MEDVLDEIPLISSSNFMVHHYGTADGGELKRSVTAVDMELGEVETNNFGLLQTYDPLLIGEAGRESIIPLKRIKEIINMSGRRVVQVIIVDDNEFVPLKDSLLFMDKPRLTDATDQELFFEIGIMDILNKHNTMRIKLKDDKKKNLKPARIRDLKMAVVNVALFNN